MPLRKSSFPQKRNSLLSLFSCRSPLSCLLVSYDIRLREAIVTQGGVSLKEVNPKTMESKLVKNLYITGELLDLDADTGGYNLQIAFSTGYAAGKAANE